MVDSYRDFEFPPELCAQPTCLIGFMGLNVQNNSVHKNIWDAFSFNRESDRIPFKFLNLSVGYNFPVSKPKRTSYEWCVPKGILKCNWMNKHFNLIPSLIVLFYELEWGDPHLTEKKLECSTCVRNIKASFEERNTKVAIVLIQKNDPLLTGTVEDSLITERSAEALCASCEINRNCLLLLHLNDHLQGYVLRLENAFHELSQSYYQQEIRQIRSHTDYLNKTAHQYLFVRHQFKIAFLNELKQDLQNARKHYAQAYSNLMELRVSDIHAYEIKVIAAFIIYKLCKLHFSLNQPRDAISLFSTHMQRYKTKPGPVEFTFEHLTWLSKQCAVFGDLFDEATKQGLPAVQTKHPGFYYEDAAEYAMQRKKFMHESLQGIETYPESDPLLGWDKLEFYGQRPWRVGKVFTEPTDNEKEKLGIVALQYREKFIVNYSALIIGYIGSAISQFKVYRSPRKRRYLVVQMAEEYYSARDYGKALTLFSHMLWEYRVDKWWPIVAHLTESSLKCSYLTTNLSTYVELCIEGACVFENSDHKIRAMDNLSRIVKGQPPIPEPDMPESDVIAASILWSSMVMAPFKLPTVDMNTVTSFVYCKARFIEANIDSVSLEIFFKSVFPEPIKFSKLLLTITGVSGNNSEFIISKGGNEKDTEVDSLLFQPDIVKQFSYKFTPPFSDVGTEIKISGIFLILGSEEQNDHPVTLQFPGSCKQFPAVQANFAKMREHMYFDKIKPNLNIYVKPKIALISLTAHHNAPNLVAEWYPVTIEMENKELSTANNCKLQFNFSPSESNQILDTTDVMETINGPTCVLPFEIGIGDLQTGQTYRKTVYIKTRSTDTRNFIYKVNYDVYQSTEQRIACSKEQSLTINCVNVFEVTASFLSMKCQYIDRLYANEPIFMNMQIDCISPWSVIIENTSFKLNNEINWDPETYESQLKNQRLEKSNVGCELVSFTVENPTTENPLSLGIFSIIWRRDDASECYITYTNIQLPEIRVNALPVYVQTDVPTPGYVRKPLTMSVTVTNRSEELIPFTVTIDHDDAFMFSGNKQANFNILPEASHTVYYNLFPLHSGLVTLPRINLTTNSTVISEDALSSLLKRTLPTVLFILPQMKGNLPLQDDDDILSFTKAITGNDDY